MQLPVVIIGSGFAGYQVAREFRQLDNQTPVIIVTADNGDDYSKPLISHGFSRRLSADTMIQKRCNELAEELAITILPNTRITAIDVQNKAISYGDATITYRDLVLATGAEAAIPSVCSDSAAQILTLNSLEEYRHASDCIADKQRVLVIGTGLVGTEIALDLSLAGKDVRLVGMTEQLMGHLLPDFISKELKQRFQTSGCQVITGQTVVELTQSNSELRVTLSDCRVIETDAVIAATGLQPRTALAKAAGLRINRGICVDAGLQTSKPHIYALGDGAEINGTLLPYLQPIALSAKAMAKTLTGNPTDVVLPAMPVIIKTPVMPIQLSGETSGAHLNWLVEQTDNGMIAKAYVNEEKMVGYVVTDKQIAQGFSLLAQLRAAA